MCARRNITSNELDFSPSCPLYAVDNILGNASVDLQQPVSHAIGDEQLTALYDELAFRPFPVKLRLRIAISCTVNDVTLLQRQHSIRIIVWVWVHYDIRDAICSAYACEVGKKDMQMQL